MRSEFAPGWHGVEESEQTTYIPSPSPRSEEDRLVLLPVSGLSVCWASQDGAQGSRTVW